MDFTVIFHKKIKNLREKVNHFLDEDVGDRFLS